VLWPVGYLFSIHSSRYLKSGTIYRRYDIRLVPSSGTGYGTSIKFLHFFQLSVYFDTVSFFVYQYGFSTVTLLNLFFFLPPVVSDRVQ
jgi:hypothetical protein